MPKPVPVEVPQPVSVRVPTPVYVKERQLYRSYSNEIAPAAYRNYGYGYGLGSGYGYGAGVGYSSGLVHTAIPTSPIAYNGLATGGNIAVRTGIHSGISNGYTGGHISQFGSGLSFNNGIIPSYKSYGYGYGIGGNGLVKSYLPNAFGVNKALYKK